MYFKYLFKLLVFQLLHNTEYWWNDRRPVFLDTLYIIILPLVTAGGYGFNWKKTRFFSVGLGRASRSLDARDPRSLSICLEMAMTEMRFVNDLHARCRPAECRLVSNTLSHVINTFSDHKQNQTDRQTIYIFTHKSAVYLRLCRC